jgi:uncharacterized protein involved in exopolysaccharide biosynthesis
MTESDFNNNSYSLAPQMEGKNNLINILTALGEEKKTVFSIVVICLIIGLAKSLLMVNIYTARTVIIPPQRNQSSAISALASLGGVASLAGGALGIKNPSEMYVAFMQSETLQNNLIEQLKLRAVYKTETLADTRKVLMANIKITVDKKADLISLEVDDKSPVFAAQLANAFVEELRKLLGNLAVTEAQERRLFLEKLIAKTKESLAIAELASIKSQETSGILSLDTQTASALRVAAELRAQITLREVQLQTMSSYASAQNSGRQKLLAELSALRSQLSKLEQGTDQKQTDNKSANALANLRAFREVKYQEAVLETLIKQYELARVEEAKEGPLLQQLDVARPPEKKSKPQRTLIVIMSAFLGLILGLVVAFSKRGLRIAARDPAFTENIKMMRRAWAIKARRN